MIKGSFVCSRALRCKFLRKCNLARNPIGRKWSWNLPRGILFNQSPKILFSELLLWSVEYHYHQPLHRFIPFSEFFLLFFFFMQSAAPLNDVFSKQRLTARPRRQPPRLILQDSRLSTLLVAAALVTILLFLLFVVAFNQDQTEFGARSFPHACQSNAGQRTF